MKQTTAFKDIVIVKEMTVGRLSVGNNENGYFSKEQRSETNRSDGVSTWIGDHLQIEACCADHLYFL